MTHEPEIPMVHYWRGKRVEEMTREELIEAVVELGKELQGAWRTLSVVTAASQVNGG